MHGIEKLRPGYVRFTAALLLVVWSCFAPGPVARAQSAPQKTVVKGRVADEAGNPLVGVTVVEHGTPNGVATLSDGGFSISVRPGAVLDFSCLGYLPRRIVPGSRTELEIVLQEDVKSIEDVIVTALGLERNYVDLTYAADKIKGSQLTAVKSPNLILSLAGKSAGMQVNQSSSGAGSSAKVSIRGVRSVASDNQPLYVVDGMPMLKLLNRIFRSRTLKWLFSWGVHPDWALRFGSWWSGKSRKGHNAESVRGTMMTEPYTGPCGEPHTEPLIAYAREYAETHEVDHFVFGHMHFPRDYRDGRLHVVNLGCWAENPSYAVLDGTGELTLKMYTR